MTEEAETIYRSISTHELRILRHAFRIDAEHGGFVSFCRDRIALIERILAERSEPFVDERTLDRPGPWRVSNSGVCDGALRRTYYAGAGGSVAVGSLCCAHCSFVIEPAP